MHTAKNKILVPIDFEEQAMNALYHSYELARLFDADLIFLYVIENTHVFGKLRSPEEYFKKVLAEAHERFDELEKLARDIAPKSSVKVSVIIEKGKPYEKIIETASDYEALLIVMGKNSSSTQGKTPKFIGSNTMNVVRDAHCPVVTIRDKVPKPGCFKTILLPLDFTRQTKKQVQKAIELGGYFNAKISVLSVVTGENKVTRLLKQVQLNQVKNAIQRHGIACSTDIVQTKTQEVADTVIDYSHKVKADLIIIMTQQKKRFVSFYVGSTAQDIIYKSSVPVLSIVPTAEFRPGVVTSMVDPFGLINKKSVGPDEE